MRVCLMEKGYLAISMRMFANCSYSNSHVKRNGSPNIVYNVSVCHVSVSYLDGRGEARGEDLKMRATTIKAII